MNKENSRPDFDVLKDETRKSSPFERHVRVCLVAALGALFAFCMPDKQHAQPQRFKEPVVRVTGVTCGAGNFSIVADDSLSRAQTWQDGEGFHLVLVNGQAAFAGAPCGVKVRHVGNSVELVVPVRPGASVTVSPRGSRLDLAVSGGSSALSVENFPVGERAESATREKAGRRGEEQQQEQTEYRAQQPPSKHRGAAGTATPSSAEASSQQKPSQAQQQQRPQQPQQNQKSDAAPADLVNLSSSPSQQATQPAATTNAAPPPPAVPAELNASEGFNSVSFLTSLPVILVALAALLAGAVVLVIRRGGQSSVEEDEASAQKKQKAVEGVAKEESKPFLQSKGDRRKSSIAVPFDRRTSGRGAEDEATRRPVKPGEDGQANGVEHASRAKVDFATSQAEQFGAYRIEQEITRLVQGKPHSVEIVASRALDDRRAVEASLLKALRSNETTEDGRRRVRMALEDYGFVARACATLLLGAESFERASSARSLGEMRSAHALPFLTEALYDPDAVVRTECVQSLGSLGLPSAIGALLDVARRHADIPSAVLGPALTACSVESIGLNPGSNSESRTFAGASEVGEFSGEAGIAPVPFEYEELPDWVEDESLRAALEQLRDADVETRVKCAQHLALFQVRRAVEALANLARHDEEPAVRSAAVTSLGLVGHESVFVPVILGLSDDAREVRAASARALSRLSFDRAEGYVRVIETADEPTLRLVASACVKAGLVSQAISRLVSEDRRQSYEAYSLLSLCAKAGETQPLLDTVECHRDIEVRLACVSLLGLSTQPDLREQLLRIAGNGGVPERVRRSIVEALGQVAEPQPVAVR